MRETDRPALEITDTEVIVRLDGRRLRVDARDLVAQEVAVLLSGVIDAIATDLEASSVRCDVDGDAAYYAATTSVAVALRSALGKIAIK